MPRKKKSTPPPKPRPHIDISGIMQRGWDVAYEYGPGARVPGTSEIRYVGHYVQLKLQRVLAPGCALTVYLEGQFDAVAAQIEPLLVKIEAS